MILDEALQEDSILNSFNEEQQEFVIDAYIAGYITALESYVDFINENIDSFDREKAKGIISKAQSKYDNAIKNYRDLKSKIKHIDGLDNSKNEKQMSAAKNNVNGAYKRLANVKRRIDEIKKNRIKAA